MKSAREYLAEAVGVALMGASCAHEGARPVCSGCCEAVAMVAIEQAIKGTRETCADIAVEAVVRITKRGDWDAPISSSSEVHAYIRLACCERDVDGDGNCDRHRNARSKEARS